MEAGGALGEAEGKPAATSAHCLGASGCYWPCHLEETAPRILELKSFGAAGYLGEGGEVVAVCGGKWRQVSAKVTGAAGVWG